MTDVHAPHPDPTPRLAPAPRPDLASRLAPAPCPGPAARPDSGVRPDALAVHAAQLTAAVAALEPGALPAALRRLATATPGSRTAAAAEALADRWESAVRAWVADVRAHGSALAHSAEDYAGTDHDVAAAMRAAA